MAVSSTTIMWSVAAATLPAIAAHGALYGGAVWLQLGVLAATALLTEAACLRWRGKPLRAAVAAAADGSALVAACVLTVALPPHAPWVVAATAALLALALGKHCYGGLGNNPFNPAMVGYALAFFAFPEHFAAWTADAVTSPTPLAASRVEDVAADAAAAPWRWESRLWLPAAAACAGGALLLALRFADWRLTLAFLLGAIVVIFAGGGEWRALLHGGMIFAAFFVITDPVTAAASRRGRWLYGFLTGALAMWLRQHGAHTDAIAFAVLIGNMLAPLCDWITARRQPPPQEQQE